ncbi:DUF6809 family protein [Paenibacillus sonchi]|uniref:DUF6809 family protein n=1 Tax=Paenibacillus sonchi TaxID=373687 RepID=UPI001E5DB26A|nr:DUF6809 family protein [Paenibacillus sonchi]MCE3201621.1 hypothetical protein [Paenibacillus sonchi]
MIDFVQRKDLAKWQGLLRVGIHPEHSECQDLNRKISSFINAYLKKLSPDDYDELEKLIDLLGQSTSMYSAPAYTEGFRLGAWLSIGDCMAFLFIQIRLYGIT